MLGFHDYPKQQIGRLYSNFCTAKHKTVVITVPRTSALVEKIYFRFVIRSNANINVSSLGNERIDVSSRMNFRETSNFFFIFYV